MAKITDDDSGTNAASAPIVKRPDAGAGAAPALPNTPPPSTDSAPIAPPGLTAPPSRPTPAPASTGADFPTKPVVSGQSNGNVGAMVNGVQTFNDATVPRSFIDRAAAAPSVSDVASTIPKPTLSGTFNGRTYSGAELDKLANSVNVVPAANFTRPGLGTLGMPVSADQGIQMAAMSIPRPVAPANQDAGIARPAAVQRPDGYDPTAAARDYQSNLADVINRDPRSISGTAAHNADADRIWNRALAGSSIRKQNAADAIYDKQISALTGMPQGIFDARNAAGNANARDQTQFADTQNTNATNLLRTGFETNARLTGAEARADALRYGADQRAGSTMYAADSRGNAARDVATTRANVPKIDSASTAAAGRIYQQVLQDGKSPEDAHAAVQGWLQARQGGAPSASSPQPQQSPSVPPPDVSAQDAQDQEEIDRRTPTSMDIYHLRTFVKSNPMLRGLFDARFGRGAADKVLGPQQ
ncbi:MAG: hypothetical protein QM741_10865 [Rudaea sp.]|uniref:hypothetical protein n=1 Tax=Rudaea sp. TaxID=2136325 RepID=UPI0039E559D8